MNPQNCVMENIPSARQTSSNLQSVSFTLSYVLYDTLKLPQRKKALIQYCQKGEKIICFPITLGKTFYNLYPMNEISSILYFLENSHFISFEIKL